MMRALCYLWSVVSSPLGLATVQRARSAAQMREEPRTVFGYGLESEDVAALWPLPYW